MRKFVPTNKFIEMVGRRQLREKVVETLYAYQQNPKDANIVLKNMMMEIGKIYDLYVYELNFLLAMRDLAEEQMGIAKNKFLKTDADINPNLKFIQNQVLKQLSENQERVKYSEKNKQLTWDLDDSLVRRTFQRARASKKYKDYMESTTQSFEDDQKFVGRIFLRYVAENNELHDWFETKEISWTDDVHIANSLVQKTIGFMSEGGQQDTLMKVIKNEDDESFVKTLLSQCIHHMKDLEKKLTERLQNWDLERVSVIDKIILITAFCEMDYFKSTPSSVIINEYIEIAKTFSSEKSNVFINGILDKYSKDQNRI